MTTAELRMMDAKTLIASETERLSHYSKEAAAEVRVLFEHITGEDCIIASISSRQIADEKAVALSCAIDRLIGGEPIQYVIGEWSFMGNDFTVTPAVLIPRADTEILCAQAIEYVKAGGRYMNVLDLCAGSGCVGISVAKSCANCYVECVDISGEAIKIINENIVLNNVRSRVRAYASDMFENCGIYDVIVSNPPYVPREDIETLENKVKCYEPRIALDGGDDGLDFYRIIARNAKRHLNNGGKLFLEIGWNQRADVMEILRDNDYKNIECVKDYSQNDRVVYCGL